MLNFLHRDILNRVIKQNDYVVWSNGKYGQQMQICSVESATELTVRIVKPDGRLTNVSPKKLLVVTQQILDNVNNNVGANL